MKYKRPDANQLQIEHYLQELGFWTYRTANDAPQPNSGNREFHPLDLLVIGINRHTDRVEMTMWELKVSDGAPFTEKETAFIQAINAYFSRPVPVTAARSLNEILAWYGWVDT